MDKTVFVIIVTYNGARWIDKNITSLRHSSYPVRIIVVDNNSTDNSVALLKNYPEVDLIQSPDNLGFGKANNIGMKRALELGADYLFLLNQDAWVFTDTVKSLVQKMEARPQFGITSPMHYSGNDVDLDAAFATYNSRKTSEKDNVATVPFVNAAAWLVSRTCVEKTGYFEPLFGHYGEDRNYTDRVTYHKFLIGIDADSKIVHDRIISRNFNKDVTQSQYKILSTLINPGHSFAKAWILGLKEVVGLPKYFAKFYGAGKAMHLFLKLAGYYITMLFKTGQVSAARNNAK
ncbi:glycosyltransferase family 2 protein [Flavobacterium zepuense]|uniref:Glycosyltransferase family 2 protein n=1 Tax=Flavobacterium zepuense TaxID=2593302 RepID=A0A552V4D4_9FLAO|nr:glycosyltransferase family 2 protein [Flavobacterium zepuense]TRW25312.1 glycosyltransferase family 2 protein [Flavobacterium zepuense]